MSGKPDPPVPSEKTKPPASEAEKEALELLMQPPPGGMGYREYRAGILSRLVLSAQIAVVHEIAKRRCPMCHGSWPAFDVEPVPYDRRWLHCWKGTALIHDKTQECLALEERDTLSKLREEKP